MEEGSVTVLGLRLTRGGGDKLKKLTADETMLDLLGIEASLEEFERKAVQLRPHILLVEYAPEELALINLLERLRGSVPTGAIIAYSESKEPEHIIQAVRLGVREYLTDEGDPHQAFKDAILRIRMPAGKTGTPQGRLFGVVGSKGGAGASQVAINLAWALSQVHGQRVALVDMDLFGGNLAFLLDLEPKRTWGDAAATFEALDDLMMDGLLTEVAPGFRLLAAPEDPAQAEEVEADHVVTVLEFLVRTHSAVIMDMTRGLEEESLAAMDMAEKIFLILEPTVLGLKTAVRMASLSQRLGHDPEKVRPIVNRADSKMSILPREVEEVLGQEVLAWLPNEYRNLIEANNTGKPILMTHPKCKWSKAVFELAEKVARGEDEVL